MNKTINITVTRIDNGYIVSGSDETAAGPFGQPLETGYTYVPSVKELSDLLPSVLIETLRLDHQAIEPLSSTYN